MPKVGIVMGSDSDMKVMGQAADMLEKLGVEYEMTIISAHREPDVFYEYAKSAEDRDFKVIIAGAGMAAHLSDAGHWYPDDWKGVGRTRRTVFYRSDAAWNSGCDRSDRRREECGDPCGKDSCHI